MTDVSSSGMILTLKDIGVPECVLSGPPQLVRLLIKTQTIKMTPQDGTFKAP